MKNEITNSQHAQNVKNMMLNNVDAVYNAIKAGRDPRQCKKMKLWLDKTNAYINKHNLIKVKN